MRTSLASALLDQEYSVLREMVTTEKRQCRFSVVGTHTENLRHLSVRSGPGKVNFNEE